jgi:hypothetical protein
MNQWSIENKDGAPKKDATTVYRQPHMAEPRLDAHHTVTTGISMKQSTDGNSNHHMSQEEFTPELPLSDQHIRSKNYMPCGTDYKGASINKMHKDYGTHQTSASNDPGHENWTNTGVHHSRHGAPQYHSTHNSSAGENQPAGTSGNCNVGYYISSAEQDKMYSGGTFANGHFRREKTGICSPDNSKGTKGLGSPRSFTDSCKWLQPYVLDNVGTFDMEKRICIEQPHAPPSTALGHKQFRISTALPSSQTIQRSASMIEPKLDCRKFCVPADHDLRKTVHNEKLPQVTADGSCLAKPHHHDINNAIASRNPYINMCNNLCTAENNSDQCGLGDGKQIHNYLASTSQQKMNQNNVTSSMMQKDRNSFSRSGSFGFQSSHSDEPSTSTVPEFIQPIEVGEIWKEVILAR